MRRALRLPVFAQGRDTGEHIEVAGCLTFPQIGQHLRWLGFVLTQTPRGRLALERLH